MNVKNIRQRRMFLHPLAKVESVDTLNAEFVLKLVFSEVFSEISSELTQAIRAEPGELLGTRKKRYT